MGVNTPEAYSRHCIKSASLHLVDGSGRTVAVSCDVLRIDGDVVTIRARDFRFTSADTSGRDLQRLTASLSYGFGPGGSGGDQPDLSADKTGHLLSNCP